MSNLLFTQFIILISITFLGFLFSRVFKRLDIADVMWGLGFIIIATVNFILFSSKGFMPSLLLGLTVLWGVRLATFIGFRNSKKTEDIRYLEMKKNWGKKEPINAFIRVFFLQAILMYIIALPLIHVSYNSQKLLPINFIGLTLFLIGFIWETVADFEMMQFKKKKPSPILNSGLWSLSRHPNYFREALIWWGIFFLTLNHFSDLYLIISPLLITFLLLKVSGVAMTDKIMEKKGDDFKKYADTVPAFLPLKTQNLILFLKAIFCITILDYIWLGNIFKNFYIQQSEKVAMIVNGSFDVVYWAAAGVYFFIPLGVVIFGCIQAKDRVQALFKGYMFGLVLYGTYDLTNMALLKNWPIEMSVIDIIWGPFLCGLTSFIIFSNKNLSR